MNEILKSIDTTLKLILERLPESEGFKPKYQPTPQVMPNTDTYHERGYQYFNFKKELQKRNIDPENEFINALEKQILQGDLNMAVGWITRNGVKMVTAGYLELIDNTNEIITR